MIYIFVTDDEIPTTVAVIEGPATGIDLNQLYQDYKKEWYRDLDYTPEKYNQLLRDQGYTEARSYLQRYRDGYDSRVKKLGTPAVAFARLIKNDYKDFKPLSWTHIYLGEEL